MQCWEQFGDWYSRQLVAAEMHGVPAYELDWLILQSTQLDKLDLRLQSSRLKDKISPELMSNLDRLWQQRLQNRTPVQYLVGSTSWRNLELQVSPDVLIPRPETELILDIVANNCLAIPDQQGYWVDLGTGSGAIAIALAQYFPHLPIQAVDLSIEALAIAQSNAYRHGITNINFACGSWFEPLASCQGQILGMVSNPPYIPSAEVLQLQPEVTNHEPHLALDGGADGLDAIRHLVAIAPAYLVSGGFWLVELMAGQAPTVRSLLKSHGKYWQVQIHKDYAGIERFVSARTK
ncbi:MAG: peptide chain release factor N(5)-glutamine methyltransferase [Pseudanabaenaceae cyanobacterium bins.39]|nr:peptide chain release factor N(5)-glutamine methyltransferase [Pseudanabaenaceae cyanobacterium bins.39]